jgi:hypothetical protein
MKESGNYPQFEGWAEGYGAFTYAYRNKKTISNYIRNQEAHHNRQSFLDEYIKFLQEFGINYNEKYL